MRLVFLDTETTGLDPDRHEVWEVGAIVRDYRDDGTYEDEEHHWFLFVDLTKADLIALNIGGYFDRHPSSPTCFPGVGAKKVGPENLPCPRHRFAREFFQLSHKANIVGCVPNFDTERIARILNQESLLPTWNYHLIDVENLIAGWKQISPPWKSKDLSEAVGIDTEDEKYAKHTALGDARWARDLYDAVMGERDGGTRDGRDTEPSSS